MSKTSGRSGLRPEWATVWRLVFECRMQPACLNEYQAPGFCNRDGLGRARQPGERPLRSQAAEICDGGGSTSGTAAWNSPGAGA